MNSCTKHLLRLVALSWLATGPDDFTSLKLVRLASHVPMCSHGEHLRFHEAGVSLARSLDSLPVFCTHALHAT